MDSKQATPRYAIRLFVLIIIAAVVFFGGLQLFVPDGSKLTGSYDAKSLRYIAAAPLAYAGSASCGEANCHQSVYQTWSQGAHGIKREQSKCEVCHGPQREHPQKTAKLLKVRGDGDVVKLCLTCHQKMKARKTTGQPQIEPQQHPYPHQDVLNCTQCHNPHSPALSQPKPKPVEAKSDSHSDASAEKPGPGETLAGKCTGCHGLGGKGGFAPVLAGKPYQALKQKLTEFKSGANKNPIMSPVVEPLSDSDLDILAKYFSKAS